MKAITFDLDNTLIDFMRYKRLATDAAMDAMIKAGFKGDKKKLHEELFEFYLKYGIESNDPFDEFLKKKNAYSLRILAAGINAYRRKRHGMIRPYHGVIPTLKKLKKQGYKLAIVTDAPKLKAYMRLDMMGIVDYFDVIVGYEDTNRRKPSKLPFKKALKELKVKAADAMHVGDWRERDILGAKKMGMKSCFARYGGNKLGKLVWADHYIDRFEDLLKIL